jgi:hypothetical protein
LLAEDRQRELARVRAAEAGDGDVYGADVFVAPDAIPVEDGAHHLGGEDARSAM